MGWLSKRLKSVGNFFKHPGRTIKEAYKDGMDTIRDLPKDTWDTLDKNWHDIVVDPIFSGKESRFWKTLAAVVGTVAGGSLLSGGGSASGGATAAIGGGMGGIGDIFSGLKNIFSGNFGEGLSGVLEGVGNIGQNFLGGSGGSGSGLNLGNLGPLLGWGLAQNTKNVPQLDNLYSLLNPINQRSVVGSDIATTALLGNLANTPYANNVGQGLLGLAFSDPLAGDVTTQFFQDQAYENALRAARGTGAARSSYMTKFLADQANQVAYDRYREKMNALGNLFRYGNALGQTGINTAINLGKIQSDINMANAGVYNQNRALLGNAVTDIFSNQRDPRIDAIMDLIYQRAKEAVS